MDLEPFRRGDYFLSCKLLNTTVASTLVVTTLNITLLIIIPLFALPYVQPANLVYGRIPFVKGQPFDPTVLRLIFGVMLSNYFSHLLVANYGRVILRRDPSARSWIWGVIAAIGITTLISCLWVILVNGALSPSGTGQLHGHGTDCSCKQGGTGRELAGIDLRHPKPRHGQYPHLPGTAVPGGRTVACIACQTGWADGHIFCCPSVR